MVVAYLLGMLMLNRWCTIVKYGKNKLVSQISLEACVCLTKAKEGKRRRSAAIMDKISWADFLKNRKMGHSASGSPFRVVPCCSSTWLLPSLLQELKLEQVSRICEIWSQMGLLVPSGTAHQMAQTKHSTARWYSRYVLFLSHLAVLTKVWATNWMNMWTNER